MSWARPRLSERKLSDKALWVKVLPFSSSLPAATFCAAFHCLVPYIHLLLGSLKCPPCHGSCCSECRWASAKAWQCFVGSGPSRRAHPLHRSLGSEPRGVFPIAFGGTGSGPARSWRSHFWLWLWSTRGKVTLSVVQLSRTQGKGLSGRTCNWKWGFRGPLKELLSFFFFETKTDKMDLSVLKKVLTAFGL